MTRKAYIVWNEDKTEGVIFVDARDEQDHGWPLTAADDAHEALTGNPKRRGLGSCLAQSFNDIYDPDEKKLSLQVVAADDIAALSDQSQ